MKIAIVGYGTMGKVHSMAVHMQKTLYPSFIACEVGGIVSAHPQAIQQACAEQIYPDLESMLKDETIQLVDIDTPNFLHYEQACRCIEKHKHLYIEKPVCMNLKEAQMLNDRLKDTDLINQTALVYRFIPAIARLRDLCMDQTLGTILHFNIHLLHASNLNPQRSATWRNNQQKSGGGAVLDLGIHCFDCLRFVLGEVAEVSSLSQIITSQRGGTVCDSDDASFVTLRMKDGAIGHATLSKVSYTLLPEFQFEIFGTKGSAYVDSDHFDRVRFADYENRREVVLTGYGDSAYSQYLKSIASRFPLGKDVEPHVVSMHSVLRAVDEGNMQAGVPTVEEAMRSQSIVEACLHSSLTKKWEKVVEVA